MMVVRLLILLKNETGEIIVNDDAELFDKKKISKPFQLLKNNQNNTHVHKIESFTMLQSPNT